MKTFRTISIAAPLILTLGAPGLAQTCRKNNDFALINPQSAQWHISTNPLGCTSIFDVPAPQLGLPNSPCSQNVSNLRCCNEPGTTTRRDFFLAGSLRGQPGFDDIIIARPEFIPELFPAFPNPVYLRWYVRRNTGGGYAGEPENTAGRAFGNPCDRPVVGNWSGSGDRAAVWQKAPNGQHVFIIDANNTLYYEGAQADPVYPWPINIGPEDELLSGDFTSDPFEDLVVWRPPPNLSQANWNFFPFSNGLETVPAFSTQFGLRGDKPVVADFNDDGHADIAVWRPSNDTLYINLWEAGDPNGGFGFNDIDDVQPCVYNLSGSPWDLAAVGMNHDGTTANIYPAPTLAASATNVCAGTIVSFAAVATPPGTVVDWFIGGCDSTPEGSGPTFASSGAGNFSVSARHRTCSGDAPCATVNITVTAPPVAPASSSVDRSPVCVNGGGTINLDASGGSGQVLVWREGGCAGAERSRGLSPRQSIAAPTQTTTYYPVWESPPCAPACGPGVTVVVDFPPLPPGSIISNPPSVCVGSTCSLELTARRDDGGPAGVVRWYGDSCGGELVGTGNPLIIPCPPVGREYFARWENACGASSCLSTVFYVYPRPAPATEIRVNPDPLCGAAGTIVVEALGGEGSMFEWYEGTCCGTIVGAGRTIVLPAAPLPRLLCVRSFFPACGYSVPRCRLLTISGDYNANGSISPQDIFDFLRDYFACSGGGDYNGMAGCTVQDVFDFLDDYFTCR